jgi:prepilin-type N-terminal cleavage/methylation domain-containing protein
MRIFGGTRPGGFVLTEMMISIVVFSTISMGLLMGFVSLERNFAATTDFATNHADAIRISDYLALDLRRALAVQAAQNDTTIWIPSYYDANGAPQMPTLDGHGGVFYGSNASSSVVVRYDLLNSTIYRQQGAAPTVAIAENVRDFVFDVTDSGKVVTTRITFNTTYTSAGATNAALGAPTTNTASAVYNTTLLRNTRTDIASGVY